MAKDVKIDEHVPSGQAGGKAVLNVVASAPALLFIWTCLRLTRTTEQSRILSIINPDRMSR